MRAVFGVFALLAVATLADSARADPPEPYAPAEGKYKVRFPGAPKSTSKTTKSDLDELTVNVATYVNSDGHVYMVSYSDFPSAPRAETHADLFAGVREGVKGSAGKSVGDETATEFGPDKWPSREFVVDKGKQRTRMRVVLRENRLYQLAVIGSADFVGGNDAKRFFDSFELTK